MSMTGPESGEGGGRECVDVAKDGGVEAGLGGGVAEEALRLRFVRREAKKAGV